MTLSNIKIGDLAHPEPGSFKIGPFGSSLKKEELTNSGIPLVGIENILPNEFSSGFHRFINTKKYEELKQYTIRPKDILVTTMGTIGRAAIVPENISTMIIDSHLFRMRVDDTLVFAPYLCYAINGYTGIKQQLKRMSRGAIMDGLNTTILKECSLPLPPLPEQQRLAAILEKADRLRRQRRYALTLSETYLQSVFLQMFKVANYQKIPFVELALKEKNSFVNGPFGSDLLTTELVDNGVPVIYIRDISKGYYKRASKVCVTPEKAKQLNFCRVDSGDVLITKVGDPPGSAAIYPFGEPSGIVTQDVIRIKTNEKLITAEYLVSLLNSTKGYNLLKPIIIEATRERFGLTPLKQLEIPIPEIKLQQQFSHLFQKHQRVTTQQREALRQSEHLFQTLLHRAFTGHLPLPSGEGQGEGIRFEQDQDEGHPTPPPNPELISLK